MKKRKREERRKGKAKKAECFLNRVAREIQEAQ